MCGIAGVFGPGTKGAPLDAMLRVQHHRGPDDRGLYMDPAGSAGLAHNRLSIIDLSSNARQPMSDAAGNRWIAFNGEIYNFLELRRQLDQYAFRTKSDTEVLLAAFDRWGYACLDRLVGMFAFLLWDTREQQLWAVRDRFGVKPLYYAIWHDNLYAASEIRALHAAGVPAEIDEDTWATYLAFGLHDHTDRTFWRHVRSLPPGHMMTWQHGKLCIKRWYDLAERTGSEFDRRPVDVVQEEYSSLLTESIQLRFRSDVEVAINVSGGLDSSALLGLVRRNCESSDRVKAFTYTTGDERYDELPWVSKIVEQTGHPLYVSELRPDRVPDLAFSVQSHEDEPFGGFPTLAYAALFEVARQAGVTVLLDGQGMDEQWAGYDYYDNAQNPSGVAPLQGTKQRPVRPECLTPEFLNCAVPFHPLQVFPDALRNRQYLDTRYTKIPRALRFNDRISMRVSTELREPFMDHRLFELAFRQPSERKISPGTRKWLLRKITRQLLPSDIVEAPKRPVQTPQREWLAGPLSRWAQDCIELGLGRFGGTWFKQDSVRCCWQEYLSGANSNSFYVWQWVSLGLMLMSRSQADGADSRQELEGGGLSPKNEQLFRELKIDHE